jgi:hypothetical protein
MILEEREAAPELLTIVRESPAAVKVKRALGTMTPCLVMHLPYSTHYRILLR